MAAVGSRNEIGNFNDAEMIVRYEVWLRNFVTQNPDKYPKIAEIAAGLNMCERSYHNYKDVLLGIYFII